MRELFIFIVKTTVDNLCDECSENHEENELIDNPDLRVVMRCNAKLNEIFFFFQFKSPLPYITWNDLAFRSEISQVTVKNISCLCKDIFPHKSISKKKFIETHPTSISIISHRFDVESITCLELLMNFRSDRVACILHTYFLSVQLFVQ